MEFRSFLKTWLIGFLGYPMGGFIASQIFGSINSIAKACVGGLIVGSSIGAAQFLSLRKSGVEINWILGSALGVAVGALIGAGILGYSVDTSDLLIRGVITGVFIGLAQAVVLHMPVGQSIAWVAINAVAWLCGWLITSSVIVDLDSQYAVFGSTGAIVATLLQMPVMWWLLNQMNLADKSM